MQTTTNTVEQLLAQFRTAARQGEWRALLRHSDDFWALASAIRDDPDAFDQLTRTVRGLFAPRSAAFVLDVVRPDMTGEMKHIVLQMLQLRTMKALIHSDAFWKAFTDRAFVALVIDAPWMTAVSELNHTAIQAVLAVIRHPYAERLAQTLGAAFATRIELVLADAEEVIRILRGTDRDEHRKKRHPQKRRTDAEVPFLRLLRGCELLAMPSIRAFLRDPRFAVVFGGDREIGDDSGTPTAPHIDPILDIIAAYHRSYPGPSTPVLEVMPLTQARPFMLQPCAARRRAVPVQRPWLAWFSHWLHALVTERTVRLFVDMLYAHQEACREIYLIVFRVFLSPATEARIAQGDPRNETPLALWTFLAASFFAHAVKWKAPAAEAERTNNEWQPSLLRFLLDLDMWQRVVVALRSHFATATSRRDAMRPATFAAMLADPRILGLTHAFARDRFFLAQCAHGATLDALRVFNPVLHCAVGTQTSDKNDDDDDDAAHRLRWSIIGNVLRFARDVFHVSPDDALPYFNVITDAEVNYSLLSLTAYYLGYFELWPELEQQEEDDALWRASVDAPAALSKDMFGLIVLEVLTLLSFPAVVQFMKQSRSFWALFSDARWWTLLFSVSSSGFSEVMESDSAPPSAATQFFILLNDSEESPLVQVIADARRVFTGAAVVQPLVHSILRLVSLIVTYRVRTHPQFAHPPPPGLVSMFTVWGTIRRLSILPSIREDMRALIRWLCRDKVLRMLQKTSRMVLSSTVEKQGEPEDWAHALLHALIHGASAIDYNPADVLHVAPQTFPFLAAAHIAHVWWPGAYLPLFDTHPSEKRGPAEADDTSDIVRSLWIQAGMATAGIGQAVNVSDGAKDLFITSLKHTLAWWCGKAGLAREAVPASTGNAIFHLGFSPQFPHLVARGAETQPFAHGAYAVHGRSNWERFATSLDSLASVSFARNKSNAATRLREEALLSMLSSLMSKQLVRTLLSAPSMWPTMTTIRMPTYTLSNIKGLSAARVAYARVSAQYAWLRELVAQEAVRSLLTRLRISEMANDVAEVFTTLIEFLVSEGGQVLVTESSLQSPPWAILSYVFSLGAGVSDRRTSAAATWHFLSDAGFWSRVLNPSVLEHIASGRAWRAVASNPQVSLKVLQQLDYQQLGAKLLPFWRADKPPQPPPASAVVKVDSNVRVAELLRRASLDGKESSAFRASNVLRRVRRTVRGWQHDVRPSQL